METVEIEKRLIKIYSSCLLISEFKTHQKLERIDWDKELKRLKSGTRLAGVLLGMVLLTVVALLGVYGVSSLWGSTPFAPNVGSIVIIGIGLLSSLSLYYRYSYSLTIFSLLKEVKEK